MATENLDEVASNMQESAKQVLETSSGDENISFIQNVAHIVLETSTHAADSSKEYIASVVQKVQDYAEHATDSSGSQGSSLKDTLSKAVNLGALSGTSTNETGDSTATNNAFSSILSWFTQLCGSKTEGDQASNSSLKAAAEQMSSELNSSGTSESAAVEGH